MVALQLLHVGGATADQDGVAVSGTSSTPHLLALSIDNVSSPHYTGGLLFFARFYAASL